MPKRAKELRAPEVKKIAAPGLWAVGGVAGLSLQVTPTMARSWILRARVSGKRQELGLGPFPDVTLAQAKDRARELYDQIQRGADPAAERRAAREALAVQRGRERVTFRTVAERHLRAKLLEIDGKKNRDRYRSMIDQHAMPVLGDMPVADITLQDVLRVLQPLWETKTETAKKLRARVAKVFDDAIVHGDRVAANPAAWRGNLSALLPAPGRIMKVVNQPALSLKDAPGWFTHLRARGGTSARCLEFVALTAVRSGEARGVLWSEIDLDGALWTVPPERMKMKREHRVPLSAAAVALLRPLLADAEGDLVFAAPKGGVLSDMALSMVMRKMHEAQLKRDERGWIDPKSSRPAVPHGLRSTFRDYASERTDAPREVAEAALAHAVESRVEAAYRRGDLLERRRALMAAWAEFLSDDAEATDLAPNL